MDEDKYSSHILQSVIQDMGVSNIFALKRGGYAQVATKILLMHHKTVRESLHSFQQQSNLNLCHPSTSLENLPKIEAEPFVDGGIDTQAVNAVILAGLQYMAIREQSVSSFAGVELNDTDRIAKAVSFITSKVYFVNEDPTNY